MEVGKRWQYQIDWYGTVPPYADQKLKYNWLIFHFVLKRNLFCGGGEAVAVSD